MIPNTIHYCWFGKNPLPEKAKKCIESWKKYLPNWNIVEWNEDNFDLNSCQYVKEAYSCGKYAFVSDYARFNIIYEYGGLYLDTDVEIIRSIDDIVERGPFFGMEYDPNGELALNPGLGFASEPKNEVIRDLLEGYNHRRFIKDNSGNMDLMTIVTYTSNYFFERGFCPENKINSFMGYTIYPPEYMCPINYYTGEMFSSEKSFTIHHYMASWVAPKKRKWHRYEMKKRRELGKEGFMDYTLSPRYRITKSLYFDGLFATIRKMAMIIVGKKQ